MVWREEPVAPSTEPAKRPAASGVLVFITYLTTKARRAATSQMMSTGSIPRWSGGRNEAAPIRLVHPATEASHRSSARPDRRAAATAPARSAA